MYKKIIIPLGLCLTLSSCVINDNKIDKVNYDNRNTLYENQKGVFSESFTEDTSKYPIEYDERGTTFYYGDYYEIEPAFRIVDISFKISNLDYFDINSLNIKMKRKGTISTILYSNTPSDGWQIVPTSPKKIDDEITISKSESGNLEKNKYIVLVDNETKNIYIQMSIWFYEQEQTANTNIKTEVTITEFDFDFVVKIDNLAITNTNESYGDGENEYSMPTNNLMLDTTTYNDEPISLYNAKQIIGKYENGKKTIESEIVLHNLYDKDNNLVYNKDKGETLKIGDTVIFKGNLKNDYSNILDKEFYITSVEFSYNGVPKLKFKGKEV